MEEKIRIRLSQAISDQVFPGGVVGVVHTAKQYLIPFGTLDYKSNSAVTSLTIYDVASITKAIPTSCLALQLVDEGELSLQDRIQRFLPELSHREVTLWHLLTQSLSLGENGQPLQLSKLKDKTPEEILSTIYKAELIARPGKTYSYNNATSILLGLVIEKATGKSLESLAQEKFFTPLNMNNTMFHPLTTKPKIAPTEIDEWRGREIRGEVHDESAYTLRQKMVVGSAGLFSTAPDILIFMQMLLNKGMHNDRQFFSEKIIESMTTNQLGDIGGSAGLGWELDQSWYMGKFSYERMIGKTGFTGCCMVLDIEKQKGFVLLCNYTYPHRNQDREEINKVRRDVADIVFGHAN